MLKSYQTSVRKSSRNGRQIIQFSLQARPRHSLHSHLRSSYTRGMTRRRLKLIFGASLVKEPVIYQLGRKFEIVTNIRRADVTRDQRWVLLEVSGEPDELDRGG